MSGHWLISRLVRAKLASLLNGLVGVGRGVLRGAHIGDGLSREDNKNGHFDEVYWSKVYDVLLVRIDVSNNSRQKLMCVILLNFGDVNCTQPHQGKRNRVNATFSALRDRAEVHLPSCLHVPTCKP